MRRYVKMLSCAVVLALFSLLFTSYTITSRQVNNFIIKKGGFKVGTMTATLGQEGNLSFFTLTSSSSMWVGTKVWVNHDLRCVYDKQKLVRADMETNSSKGRYVSWVAWRHDHYDYDVNSFSYKRSGKFNSPIDFSIVKLYFQEPVARKQVFVENHAEVVRLGQDGQHVYKAFANAKPSTYYYSNGRLIKADLVSSSFEYSIEAVK
jgi:hypothetical protein